jgi:hypothetical protein
MAVTFKTSMNALAAIQKIGIAQSLYDWLKDSDIHVKLVADKFIFAIPSSSPNGDMTWTVDVTLAKLQALSTNTLSPVTKAQLSKEISDVIITLQATTDHAAYAESIPPKPTSSPEPAKSALGSLPPLDVISAKSKKAEGITWGSYDITKLTTGPRVKLFDAKCMYQPVSGTSSTSRYYLVAGNDEVRVAARYASTGLSIRIEGPKFDKNKAAMIELGLKVQESSGTPYASLHLSLNNDLLAAKTLGAILLGLGFKYDTPFPDIKSIKGC